MIRIYQNTSIGHALARRVTNPASPAYRIIAHLDNTGAATAEQISDFTGLSSSETASVLNGLVRKHIIREISGR